MNPHGYWFPKRSGKRFDAIRGYLKISSSFSKPPRRKSSMRARFGNKRKVTAMSTSTFIGLVLMALAVILFAYQVMAGFLGMGASDDYVYENIRLEEVVGEGVLNWIDGISSPSLQSFAETVVAIPLVILFLGGAVLCFIIHMFKGHK
jgi:hypothetical protein